MKKSLTAVAIVAALSLTACGGGGDDRPSKDEVKKELTSDGNIFGTKIPADAADCWADALVDSKLSDKALNAIVKGDKDYKGSKKDAKALTSLTSEFSKCGGAN